MTYKLAKSKLVLLPDLIVACHVGDGEAETGPLATSWNSSKFLNPAHDGAVLTILHLNGYKIASPTVLGRVSHEERDQLFRGYGYEPRFVEGRNPLKSTRRWLQRGTSSPSTLQLPIHESG